MIVILYLILGTQPTSTTDPIMTFQVIIIVVVAGGVLVLILIIGIFLLYVLCFKRKCHKLKGTLSYC